MKKIIAYLTITLISLCITGKPLAALFLPENSAAGVSTQARTQRVQAESSDVFLRVITDDTPFYADKSDDAPLFYLPYTYYVRIIDRGEIFCHVEYGKSGFTIDGFVPTDKLFSDGLAVENPYPDIYAETAATAVLYKDAGLSESSQYIFSGRKMYFYGNGLSPQGETVYFVGYNGKLGFVKESELLPFEIPLHPNELTFITPEPEPEQPQKQPDTTPAESVFSIRVAIFAVLGLAGVIAFIFALRKKPKTAPAASYYDENDYE
ncbi:MAG: hypothetical protein IJU83_02785 [Clostridia bacterium]|nr:hypothetical protein [Clostridia bacterium]